MWASKTLVLRTTAYILPCTFLTVYRPFCKYHTGTAEAVARACLIRDGELAELRTTLATTTDDLKAAKDAQAAALSKANEASCAVEELRELHEVTNKEKVTLREELREGQRLEAKIKKQMAACERVTEKLQAEMTVVHQRLHSPCVDCAAMEAKVAEKDSERAQAMAKVSELKSSAQQMREDMAHIVTEGDEVRPSFGCFRLVLILLLRLAAFHLFVRVSFQISKWQAGFRQSQCSHLTTNVRGGDRFAPLRSHSRPR